MKLNSIKSSYFLLLMGVSLTVMGQASSGMTTYSPYTPEQIREFNQQPISPVEGPFGPVNPNVQEQERAAKRQSIDSKYYRQSTGEEEAEALETESAEPYQPMKPVLTF
jgi:hypothetical protein